MVRDNKKPRAKSKKAATKSKPKKRSQPHPTEPSIHDIVFEAGILASANGMYENIGDPDLTANLDYAKPQERVVLVCHVTGNPTTWTIDRAYPPKIGGTAASHPEYLGNALQALHGCLSSSQGDYDSTAAAGRIIQGPGGTDDKILLVVAGEDFNVADYYPGIVKRIADKLTNEGNYWGVDNYVSKKARSTQFGPDEIYL